MIDLAWAQSALHALQHHLHDDGAELDELRAAGILESTLASLYPLGQTDSEPYARSIRALAKDPSFIHECENAGIRYADLYTTCLYAAPLAEGEMPFQTVERWRRRPVVWQVIADAGTQQHPLVEDLFMMPYLLMNASRMKSASEGIYADSLRKAKREIESLLKILESRARKH